MNPNAYNLVVVVLALIALAVVLFNLPGAIKGAVILLLLWLILHALGVVP